MTRDPSNAAKAPTGRRGSPSSEGAATVAELYDAWAATYDTDRNLTRDLAGEVLRAAVGQVGPGTVLELGCGTGLNTGWLAGRADRVVAADFSPGMLERARARVDAANVTFVEHDIRTGALPVEDGSADLVAVSLVLEHVEDLDAVFAGCAAALRLDGRLVVCELHPDRQVLGVKASFQDPEAGTRVEVPAWLHTRDELLSAAGARGLVATSVADHWHADDDPGGPPRLIAMVAVAAAVTAET